MWQFVPNCMKEVLNLNSFKQKNKTSQRTLQIMQNIHTKYRIYKHSTL